MPRLPIAPLLEQIHRLDEPDDAWVSRIATILLHRVRAPSGVNAYRFKRSGEDGAYRSARIATGADNEADLSQYDQELPAQAAHLIYGTGTKAELAAPLLR